MDKPIETLYENLRAHPAVLAWSTLQPERVEPESIVVIKRWKRNQLFGTYKSGVYLLNGVGPNGSGVIAKRCPLHTAAVERLIYEEFLPQVPLPRLNYYGSVLEADGQSWWLFMEEATGDLYSPRDTEHRALAARWLAAVNRAGCDPRWRNGLPARGPDHYLQLMRACRTRLRQHFTNPNLPREGPTVLPALAEQCDVLEAHWPELESICEFAPWTITHGDFVIKNVRVRPTANGPELLVFDWEYSGSGMPNIDLAQYIGGVASPDLAVYRSALEGWTEISQHSQIQQMAWCGAFFRLIESMQWSALGLADAATIYLSEPVSELREYSRRMAQVLDETGWMPSSPPSVVLSA